MPSRTAPRSRAALLFVLLVMALAGTLRAQAVRATIQGTIKDTSGAALAGASIDVRNQGVSPMTVIVDRTIDPTTVFERGGFGEATRASVGAGFSLPIVEADLHVRLDSIVFLDSEDVQQC